MIFEFTRLGTYMKVCAVDEETGLEAVVTCPANISQAEMENHALNRMKYLKEKKGKKGDEYV